MPRIDPQALLKCLNVLLNGQGGIRGSPEVKRLVALMRKFSNKLVSKCCYILILKETEDELLAQFMAEGGWGLIFQWLGDAINVNNYPFIREVMSLLNKCPISLERLKENNCPKVIKGLSKDSEDPGVRELAGSIVEKWLQFIKSGRAVVEPVPVPAAVIPAPASPPPSAPVVEEAEPLPKFKITVRDGKSVLAKVVEPPEVAQEETVVDKVRDPDGKVSKKASEKLVNRKHSDSVKRKDVSEKISSKKRDSENEPKKRSTDSDRSESRKKDVAEDREKEVKKRDSESKRRESDGKDRRHESSSKHSASSKNKDKTSSSIKMDTLKSSKSDSRDKSSSTNQSKSKDSLKDKEKSSSRDKPEEKNSEGDGKNLVDKDKDTLQKIKTPSISSLGKIPRKSNSTSNNPASNSSVLSTNPVVRPPESSPLPTARKGSYSDERKRTAEMKPSERPKTVKTLPTKFRSTGLEGEVKPPPSRADIKKKDPQPLPEKRPEPLKRSSPSTKDGAPPEKKSKVQEILAERKDKIIDKPGGIKLIPPKPKPVLLESDLFSDALTASAKLEPRKKKRRVSSSGSKDAETKKDVAEESSEPVSPVERTSSPPRESSKPATSPPRDPKPNLKFYRDTLEENDQESKKDTGKPDAKDSKMEVDEPRAKYFPEGVLVVARSRRSVKKNVRWRIESELVAIREFELDETERVNVTRNFGDMKLLDRNKEREALMSRKGGEDSMQVKIPWGPLFIVDIPEEHMPAEVKLVSEEVNIQYARQKSTLPAIYLFGELVPDTPAEPDLEHHPTKDPTIIPGEDVSGSSDNIVDFSKSGWPEPKPDPESVNVVDITMDLPTAPPPTTNAVMPSQFGAFAASGFPGFAPQGPDGWRGPEIDEMPPVPNMAFPPGPMGPMGPPMFPMGQPPFGPPGGMMPPGPDNFPMGMYGPPGPGFPPMGGPPVDMFGPQGPGPMGPGGPGPMGPGGPGPMGPPLQSWNRGSNGGWGGPRGPAPYGRNICHFFKRSGFCTRSGCRFLHPGVNCPPLS